AGIHDIANAGMASAVRMVTVQRGVDPRDFDMIAFGGAGPAHAVKVAEAFDILSVIVPPRPGLASAFGLLLSDLTHDYVRTQLMEEGRVDLARMNALFREMEAQAAETESPDAAERAGMRFERRMDLRYRFQGAELAVSLPNGELTAKDVEDAIAAFK